MPSSFRARYVSPASTTPYSLAQGANTSAFVPRLFPSKASCWSGNNQICPASGPWCFISGAADDHGSGEEKCLCSANSTRRRWIKVGCAFGFSLDGASCTACEHACSISRPLLLPVYRGRRPYKTGLVREISCAAREVRTGSSQPDLSDLHAGFANAPPPPHAAHSATRRRLAPPLRHRPSSSPPSAVGISTFKGL